MEGKNKKRPSQGLIDMMNGSWEFVYYDMEPRYKKQLEAPAVMDCFEELFDALRDTIDDAESVKRSVALLFSIKTICITYGIDAPSWWYTVRNMYQWQDDNSKPKYGYDLGGF